MRNTSPLCPQHSPGKQKRFVKKHNLPGSGSSKKSSSTARLRPEIKLLTRVLGGINSPPFVVYSFILLSGTSWYLFGSTSFTIFIRSKAKTEVTGGLNTSFGSSPYLIQIVCISILDGVVNGDPGIRHVSFEYFDDVIIIPSFQDCFREESRSFSFEHFDYVITILHFPLLDVSSFRNFHFCLPQCVFTLVSAFFKPIHNI